MLERLSEDFRHSDKAPEGFSALLGGILSGAATGVAADVMAGGLTLGGGMIVGGVLGAIGAGGLAKGINLARGDDGAHVRWSRDFFARILGASLLRYLAVAHFGRGRGEWEEGEHPEYWIAHVEGVLTRYEKEISALYAKGQNVGRTALEKELRTLLETCATRLLVRLYPEAAKILGTAPEPAGGEPQDGGGPTGENAPEGPPSPVVRDWSR